MKFFTSLLTLLLPLTVFASGSVILDADLTGTFIRENTVTFKAGSNLYINEAGGVEGSDIDYSRSEPILWTLANGQVMSLACGKIPPSALFPNGAVRIVRFHLNGEYKRGCSIVNKVTFNVSDDTVVPQPLSRIELYSSGQLAYTNHVQEGLVSVNGQSLELEAGTELMYNENGSLRFFTPKKGSQYILETEKYGPLQFEQKSKSVISISLFDNGNVERAILGQDLKLNELTLPQGTGIVLKENDSGAPSIFTAILADDLTVETTDGYSLKTKLPRFREDGSVEALVLTENFIFVNPKNSEQSMEVFASSQIFLDSDGNVEKINATIPPEFQGKLKELQDTF